MASRPRHRGGGFTLVELMVVLAILIILGSLAISKVGKPNAERASSGLAHEIFAMCQQARYAAMTGHKQVMVRIESVNPAAELKTALVMGNQTLTEAQFGPTEATVNGQDQVQVLNVIPGVSVSSAPPALMADAIALVFYPNGTAQVLGSDTNGATVYIADQTLRFPQRVLLYGRTGFAKVLAQ